jgi:peptide/nickel transport system substrate-binding protein
MGELLIPAGMVAAPGVNGYTPDLDRPAPHDPQRARALLAEAGYPDGFSVTLDCPNDWGDDEIATCKGVGEQLGTIGIRVAVNFMLSDAYEAKCSKDRQCDFRIDGWHMDPDPEKLLRELYHSQGKWNSTGYANPRVDELLGKMAVDMVTYARDAYIEEAWRIVTEDMVYLPVRHGVSVFAMRRTLEIPPDPWDVPRFRLARIEPDKAR